MASFELQCFQNEYLPQGGAEVDAIVTVCATDAGSTAAPTSPGAGRAEIIMIDVSGSMDGPRLREAREAAAAAVDCIDDGVRFALVAGNHAAWCLYPNVADLALAESSPSSREEARAAVRRLQAGGGTAIGSWLRVAAGLLRDQRGINHAILLTDGLDESETEADLDRAIEAATGVFGCDCRGVGTDWQVSELRRIATGLLGTVDIVARPEDLAEDFRRMMKGSMARQVGDVVLRLWTPRGAEIGFCKQVFPEAVDLQAAGEADPRVHDYPTGAWGDECREYHVTIRVPPAAVGDEMLAGRVTLLVGGEEAGQALVRAVWTDDVEQSSRINRMVAHYTGQEEMADLIGEALEARRVGDDDGASDKLTVALRRARDTGNAESEARILKLVEEDAATGKVRMKKQISAADEMENATRSIKTVRIKP